MKGYYSLVQFCPDMSRLEAVNVGVLLFCPEGGFIEARTLHHNKRVTKLFSSVDEIALDAAKRSLEARLQVARANFKSVEDLQKFVDTRANELRLTPPRPVKVENPQQELATLLEELVGKEPTKQKRLKLRLPQLDALFDRLCNEHRAERNVAIKVPVTNREFTVPYAFQNGRLNLVKPQMFPAIENDALNATLKLAAQGRLIHEFPDGKEKQLVVVPDFGTDAPADSLRRKLKQVFTTHSVEFVEDLDEFILKVEQEAHS
jgi:hypothetical protein